MGFNSVVTDFSYVELQHSQLFVSTANSVRRIPANGGSLRNGSKKGMDCIYVHIISNCLGHAF